ncbi:MAG TPA: c-type cytochrome [Verrucomicrobiae bacterium]|nr:c-type cytochrome [Verrucomicrobiae bacterium]
MEQNEPEPPQRYVWPRYVLGGVVLGIVLAVFWMAVLVRRIREQRDTTAWPVATPLSPTQSVTVPSAPTNPAPAQPARPTNSLSPSNSSPPKAGIDPEKAARMAEFQDTLAGGNADAGRKIFFESPAANCGKCHKAGGLGGDNGPALDGIAARQSREFILESILFPNAVIDTNFQTTVVLLKDNRGLSGTLKSESETNLVLNTPEDGPVVVQKSEIERRWIGASPMPEGIWQTLSKQELRDVIEFVASLKQ